MLDRVLYMLSPRSTTIRSERFLNVEKAQRSFHMWCDTPRSRTHVGAMAEAVKVRAEVVGENRLQSLVVARAVVVVAFSNCTTPLYVYWRRN